MWASNRLARLTRVPRTSYAGRLAFVACLALVAFFSGMRNAAAQALPPGWANQDIGAVGLAGSATYSGGTFTVQGAGGDIWGTADSFHFANRLLSGDGEIVARVASMQNTNTYAKAGVMIREALTAGSRYVLLDMKPGGGVEFMARTATGGTTSFIAGGTGRWLRLVRSGGVFTAYVSGDGQAWASVGSRSVTMGTSLWVGLAVCSHNTAALNTSVFDNVRVNTSSGAIDLPPAVSITSPASGATFTAANISITASATDDAGPVAKVQFYANNGTSNSLLGTDTTSPYTFTWNNVAAGSYSLTAVATDSANQATMSSAVGITVTAPSDPPPPVSSTQLNRPLRLVTWNIQHGDRDDDVRDIETQMDVLAGLGADVIVLQEMHTADGDYPTLYRQGISKRTGVTWNGFYASATGAACNGLEGNMILTWLPIVSSSAGRLIALPSAPCDPNGTRGVVRVELSVNSRRVQVFGTHLVNDQPAYRTTQFSLLNTYVSAYSGNKLIGGDFNTKPEESSFWSLLAAYADAWVDVVYTGDTGYTHHSLANTPPGKRIDYWLHAGADALVNEISVVQTKRSDHNPVLLDVTVR